VPSETDCVPARLAQVRGLIVNADDFGFTRGINRGVLEAHQAKIVTSATLMAQGAEVDDAVRLARAAPDLSVGCHVVLIGGSPLLPAREIPSLVVDQARGFRSGLAGFAAAALGGRLVAKEIEAEATAQIRKLQQAGIGLTHVDTHKHVHIFPQVLRPLLCAAQACGVPAVRNPFEALQFGLLGHEFRLWQRFLGVGLSNLFAGSFRRMVRDAGMMSPEGIFGVVATGRFDTRLFRFVIENVPDGTWELVCHPGYDDAQLHSMPTRLRESRQTELRLLTSPETLALLARNNVHLVSYRDLVQM
jgi:hopanoid biosynthesis associated protein HpnK